MAAILIVEDDTFLCNAYRMKLGKDGHTITIAKDGRAALDAMAQSQPDLVLLDIVMPSLDGFGVLEAMQKNEKLKNTPVIVASNLGQTSDVERAKKLGARDYVVKNDLSMTELLKKIEEYVS